VHPEAQRVLLITGTSFADRDGVQELVQMLKQYSRPAGKELMVEALRAISFNGMRKKYLSRLSPDTICVFISYYTDSEGEVFVPTNALQAFSRVSTRPIYSNWDAGIGRGSVEAA